MAWQPRTRRGVRQPADWNSVLRPQLQAAARAIRTAGYHHVLVRGQMRLPCWFAAGAHLSEADLALAVAIVMDPTPDIQAYLATTTGVGRYLAVSLPPGPGRRMITSSADATAAAVGIRDLV